MTHTEKLLTFINESPSCFHATAALSRMLADAGFTALREAEPWDIVPGGSYYVTRNGSSLIAFRIPAEPGAAQFMLTAAHSDSPTFKLKEFPELDGAGLYTRINAERYGGMIYDSWFDRPLSVAGRVLVRTESGIRSKLIKIDRDLLLIPHIAPHMDSCNEGKAWNPASDLVPLYGEASAKGTFLPLIAEAAGVKPEELLTHELFLYSRQPASVWGADDAFLSAPRLDDLECAYSCVQALIEADAPKAIAAAAVLDNEEVGSGTRQGAASTFLADVLSRICDALGGDLRIAAASSMLLSADNAHAVHPNSPGLADPTHRPKMNGGVVLKWNAAQTYTTDAVSAAIFREICRRADVPVQSFANRSDKRGGSTLGNIAMRQVSMMAVDIGLAQLAMHSSYETAGAADAAHMIGAMRAFYGTRLTLSGGDIAIG